MPIEFSREAKKAFSSEFRARILHIYSFFPELQQQKIVCGAIRKRGGIQGIATAWTSPPLFRLQPLASSFTIAHELTHLIQGNGSGIPHGEVQCDIWAVSRVPADLLDEAPSYLLNGRRLDWYQKRAAIKDLCIHAIEIRKRRRDYIVWLRSSIKTL